MHPLIARKFTYPLAQFLAGRKYWRHELRTLNKLQWLAPEKLKQLQLEQLRALLHYAISNVPYYRQLFARNQIKPSNIKDIEQLQEIPMLNKKIINTHIEDLYNPNSPGKFFRNTSSGSTGIPVAFYDDELKTSLGVAEEARIKMNFGLPLGLREARFVRLTEDTIAQNHKFYMRAMLINQLIVPGMNLSEEVFERTKDKIFAFKPQILFGISSALYDFTRFLVDQGVRHAPWKADLVICWAAPVFQHYVDLLSGFYLCPVVNLYSAREVGHLAASCPKGNLHLHEETRIIEVIKDGKRVAPCVSGDIVVTTLKPYAMPMIRYNTEDTGKISEKLCECGRGLTVLKELDGRSGEILYLSNGRIISPNYCCRLMMSPEFVGVIRQFQVIQTNDLSLEIKVVKAERFTDFHSQAIIEKFKRSLGNDVSIQLSFLERINPSPSGKFEVCQRLPVAHGLSNSS